MTDFHTSRLSPIKQALLKITDLQQEVADLRRSRDEPIAVVGIGCRLPGGSDSPERFWTLLASGTDAVTEVPADRWTDDLYDPRPGRSDTSYCRHGAFIDGVDEFDASFFGISGREARAIDPQQRLLLECAWRAIEDARFSRDSIKALRTGVFVGSSLDDYARLSEENGDHERSLAQISLGTARPFAAGRVSYLFGFHGPSLQLDTACSSSLMTTHLACQSLRQRECDVALSGGANLMLSPEMTVGLCELQALSPDGRCKTFDAAANGYVRGEGVGMVALMRLSDAVAQQRPIRALIRGSAANHDGKSNGMTAPNGRAQRDVIRDALARAGVAPGDVDYVEAHGTGTLLGDPVELRALQEVYCRDVARARPLHVGSLKTNIGHLEAAASVAALIKVVCSVQHGELPRHLHFDTPTPHVDWAGSGLQVVDRHMPWPEGHPGRRLAGISAFGMSGTNVHLIVEGWRAGEEGPVQAASLQHAGIDMFPLSGHTPATLGRVLRETAEHLRRSAPVDLAAVGHALRCQRDVHRHRVALMASSTDALVARLEARAAQLDSAGVVAHGEGGGRLAFLFTGQGAQFGGMARGLYDTVAAFRDTIDDCGRHFAELDPLPLVDVLWGDQQGHLQATRYAQPALFAVELALARLWVRWGIVPDVLMGHSVGEYAAACLAGVFSVADGLRLVAARGALMETLTPPGRMAAVQASADELAPMLAALGDRVALAADNGPRSVVVAGDPEAVDTLVQRLEGGGIAARSLPVTRAFHSPLMAPMLSHFQTVAESIDYAPPQWRLVSTVTGALEHTRWGDAAYWVEHVHATVRFRQGMSTLLGDAVDTVLEVGPGKVLAGLARACRGPAETACLHSFDAQGDAREQVLATLATLWEGGRRVDWAAVDADFAPADGWRPVTLPAYPLDPRPHWAGDRRPVTQVGRTSPGTSGVPMAGLLGRALPLPASTERRYEARVSPGLQPWLEGHRVHGRCVLPAAAFIDMALDAASRQQPASTHLALTDVAFEQALAWADREVFELGSVVIADRVDIHSRRGPTEAADAPWTRHATSRIGPSAAPFGASGDWAACRAACAEALPAAALYERLAAAGLGYQGGFRALDQIGRAAGRAVGRIDLPPSTPASAGRVVHPALIDNGFQLVAAALWEAAGEPLLLPVGMARLEVDVRAVGRARWCAVKVTAQAPVVQADLHWFDDDGTCVAGCAGLQLARVAATRHAAARPAVHVLTWEPLSTPLEKVALPDGVEGLLVGSWGPWAAQLEHRLRSASVPSVLVVDPAGPGDDDGLGHFRTTLRGFAHPSACARPTVMYHWPPSAHDSAEQVWGAHRRFAAFWQAWLSTDWGGREATLCVVTQDAQGAQPVPAQAAAWGLGRSLMHECGETRVLLVDVSTADGLASASGVLRALAAAAASDESQFVVRQGEVHVPRLKADVVGDASPLRLQGAQLVTGGRGAIGTRVVEWLVRQGAPMVVSASRRLPGAAEQARLAALALAGGVQLRFVAVDLADAASVQQLVDELDADKAHPLKGVFHAAGVLEDGLLATQPAHSVWNVMAPKVAGSLALDRATAGLALDHFTAFSSVVACLGSPGQCAYAAANAFVDALCLRRRAEGLPAQVINWGLWDGDGMARQLDAAQRRRVEAFGMTPMAPDQAMDVLRQIAGQPGPQRLVWGVDVERLLARAASRGLRPLLEGLARARPDVASADVAHVLEGLEGRERRTALAALLTGHLAGTLQVAPEAVRGDAPLVELGLDSLMAAEFRSALRTRFGIDVAFGRLLEGATLNDVVRMVMDQHPADKDAAVAPTTAASGPLRIDAVSSEALFDAELESGQL